MIVIHVTGRRVLAAVAIAVALRAAYSLGYVSGALDELFEDIGRGRLRP